MDMEVNVGSLGGGIVRCFYPFPFIYLPFLNFIYEIFMF